MALGSDAETVARTLAHADPSITLHSEYETAAAAIAALRNHEVDAAIVDNTAASIELGRAPGLRLVTALTLDPYVLAMPAGAFQLNERVNTALKELRDEGFFEQLGAKWFR